MQENAELLVYLFTLCYRRI